MSEIKGNESDPITMKQSLYQQGGLTDMTHRKIDDDVLLEMLNQGKMQKEIAEHFGVTPVAVCKRVKRLLPSPESVLDKHKLTDKEKAFCIEKAKGKTNTQAALASFECSTMKTAKSVGSELMQKPEIQMTIEELMNSKGLTKGYRIGRIKEHADSRDPNVSLKAIDMANRIDNLYGPERHLHGVVDAQTLLVQRVQERINRLRGERVIDVTGQEVNS
jgi:predicted transcriptional regulator